MNIWTRYIGGYIQECMRQGTRFIVYILDISQSFFSFKWHLKLTTKKTAHTGGKLGVFWGV